MYLRKYIPYCIEFNEITKNYYGINRDYEYILMPNIKSRPYIKNDKDEKWTRIYLSDGMPWTDKTNFKNYLKKYNEEKINNSLNILNTNIDIELFKIYSF